MLDELKKMGTLRRYNHMNAEYAKKLGFKLVTVHMLQMELRFVMAILMHASPEESGITQMTTDFYTTKGKMVESLDLSHSGSKKAGKRLQNQNRIRGFILAYDCIT